MDATAAGRQALDPVWLRALAWVEKAGNKVPSPAVLFLGLIVGVIVLSQILDWLDDDSRYLLALTVFRRVARDDVVAQFAAAGEESGDLAQVMERLAVEEMNSN